MIDKDNKNIFILGFLALLVGFSGWYGYTYWQQRSKTEQKVSEEVVTSQVDNLPTIPESKLTDFTEEEKEELQKQRVALESKSVQGNIEEINGQIISLFSLDGNQSWSVEVTSETRFVNRSLSDEEQENQVGELSDLESGMEVKVYAVEQIGTKTEFEAEKIIYRKVSG